MKQERVFTCPETEDLTGTCHLCGHGIERHGPDYECYEKPITQKKHNMEAKHTPGSWNYWHKSETDENIVSIHEEHSNLERVIAIVSEEADCPLIASAPELLEALKAFVDFSYKSFPSREAGDKEALRVRQVGLDAISRAEGGA